MQGEAKPLVIIQVEDPDSHEKLDSFLRGESQKLGVNFLTICGPATIKVVNPGKIAIIKGWLIKLILKLL